MKLRSNCLSRLLPEILVVVFAHATWVNANDATQIFERRVLPLVKSERASSCRECHLAGIDLRQYVLEDSAKTFAALAVAGLVDAEKPAKSKLLTFISRRPEKEDPLLAKVRSEELAAFQSWIEAAAKNPPAPLPTAAQSTIGSPTPLEVIRHTRIDRVLKSFVEKIWVDIERCENCHSPARNSRLIEKHGEQISWISPNDPAGTLAKSAQQGIIDVEKPEESLILLKPLGVVEHGGHRKFALGSDPDKRFRSFLADYASAVRGGYREAKDLPVESTEVRYATGQQLRITGLNSDWRDRLMRVDIYCWENGKWSSKRIATGDGYVNGPQKLWQNMILGIDDRSQSGKSAESKRLLPSGKYRVRMFLDRDKRLDRDRDYELGDEEFVGSVEFSGDWKPGYQPPKIVEFKEENATQ